MRLVRIALYCLLGGLSLTPVALGSGGFGWCWLAGIVLSASFVPVALFGPRRALSQFTVVAPGLLIVTVGMGFYLASGTLNQAALARGQVRRAAASWVAAALAFLVWNLVPIMDEFRRVEVGFAGAAALLCGLLYLLYRSPHVRPEDVVAPGSPQELEAQLAAADEVS